MARAEERGGERLERVQSLRRPGLHAGQVVPGLEHGVRHDALDLSGIVESGPEPGALEERADLCAAPRATRPPA